MRSPPTPEALEAAKRYVYPNPENNKGAMVFGHPFVFYSVDQRDSYIAEITVELACAFDHWGVDFMLRTSWAATAVRGQG
jgi:hypothetical protein